MDDILKAMVSFGPMGIVAAILFFQNNRYQIKLLDIIEKNTKAFDELKSIIALCQITHRK